MKINHNMPALRALRQLGKSETLLSDSLYKLSSGNRINRSADDAAGLAIAHKLKIQLNGLSQSSNNAWDGISLIQTAEGALNEVHAMLQRMNELSVQAANGSNLAEDRMNIQRELNQLKQEVDRLANSMDFNGVKILNGELDLMGQISDKTKAQLEAIHESVNPGKYGFTVTRKATKAQVTGSAMTGTMAADGTIQINGESFSYKQGESKTEVYGRLQQFANDLGITAGLNAGNLFLERQEYGSKPITLEGTPAALAEFGLTAGTVTGQDADAAPTGTDFPAGTIVKASGQELTFQGPDGFSIKVKIKDAANAGDTIGMELLKEGPAVLQIGANYGHTMQVRIPNISSAAIGITDVDVRSQKEAQDSIGLVKDAITLVSSIRSKMGAYQNRLEYTITNIDTSSLNMTEAHSRIMHIDMSVEMTEYTKQNVIQQAATALLAQANQKPQEMLQLLR
ncbi:flagellin protein FlaA [Lachnospiraceae bacterium oral taxon 500]|nr:flagellin protein FlaA [Lachnospiraceae bacterium oral taxon 500]